MGGVGAFLTPKVMRFENYQEEELMESPAGREKPKERLRFNIGGQTSTTRL